MKKYPYTLPLARHDENGEPYYGPDDLDDVGYTDNDPIPPFDMFASFIGPQDMHEAEIWARTPDSSLNGLRDHTTPDQLQALHAYFLGVYDKHHGLG